MASLIANFVLNGVNAGVEADGILLQSDLLLDKSVDLLLQEIALIDVDLLMLLEIFLKVGNIFNDLLQNVICRLRSMMLQSSTFASKQLHLFFVVIQKLDGFFRIPLYKLKRSFSYCLCLKDDSIATYIESIDSILDGKPADTHSTCIGRHISLGTTSHRWAHLYIVIHS